MILSIYDKDNNKDIQVCISEQMLFKFIAMKLNHEQPLNFMALSDTIFCKISISIYPFFD